MTMAPSRYLSAKEACAELGIRPQTLYAYVSRGLIRSETGDQRHRTRQYYREDIERLRRHKELRARPEVAAEQALRTGDPVLESALSRIDDDDLYYRGISVSKLARESTVEEVAALLWTGDRSLQIEEFAGETRLNGISPTLIAELARLSKVERMQALLPAIGATDPAAFATAPPHIHQCGARILRCMTLIATAQDETVSGIAQTLQSAWLPGRPETARLIEAALILCADHELNVSTFTLPHRGFEWGQSICGGNGWPQRSARTPSRWSDQSDWKALWDEAESANSVGDTIASRLKRGDVIEGFGHMVYRSVDPSCEDPHGIAGGSGPQCCGIGAGESLDRGSREADGAFPQCGSGAGDSAPSFGIGERKQPCCCSVSAASSAGSPTPLSNIRPDA